MEYTLTITDKRIWEFYQTHPNISFLEMNLFCIDFYEKLFPTNTSSLSDSLSKHLTDNLQNIQTELQNFREVFGKQQKENLLEFGKTLTLDTIGPILEKSTDHIQDKTKLWLNENLLQSLEDKFSQGFTNSQTIFHTTLSASESRLQQRIHELRELTTNNHLTQSSINNNLNDFLKKLENSSSKGRISENILYGVLQTLYPIAQLDYVGTTKESGDIILIRKNKPTVLFENKNYETNIGKSEIDKFYRDVLIQNCCGILLSQKTAIVNKENFEIEIYHGKIIVFLHNVEYNPDKIRVAIDIIDHLNETLITNSNQTQENCIVSKEILDKINKEYQDFYTVKTNQIKTIKESCQKMIDQLEELRFPNLETILQQFYPQSLCAAAKTENLLCSICGVYMGKNTKSLNTHMRVCEKKIKGVTREPPMAATPTIDLVMNTSN